MSDSIVVQSGRRKISAIWIVPAVAVVIGLWLAVDAYLKQGPTITLHFPSADSIQADKTLVKVRNVTVGTVTGVRLAEDLSGVVVTAELSPEARSLLREDSQFWVTKAEVRGASVTGLGTLLSGAYIEISPGVGELTERREFIGLERRPVSPSGTPGQRLKLRSRTSGSVGVGSPILYRGYRVGTVERIELDVQTRRVLYDIFIDAPYDELVTSNTRFWNASGISAELSTEGVKLSIGSLQSALMGGVSFDLPRHTRPGRPVEENTIFRLYPNESSIHEDPYRHSVEYVVSFRQSLRGLHMGAPVTYRGIRLGSVVRIMLEDLAVEDASEDGGRAIPVLIKLEPGRLTLEDSMEGSEQMHQAVVLAVKQGLRASLESGNLLTGNRFIEMDFYKVAEAQTVSDFMGYPTIPVISRGLDHIQEQISGLLEKLNNLPVEGVLAGAEDAIEELDGTLVAIRRLMESDDLHALPARLQGTLVQLNQVLEGFDSNSEFQHELIRTMEELKNALQSIDSVAERLTDKPNALIFPSKVVEDPEPRLNR